jgi:hypothetical protein
MSATKQTHRQLSRADANQVLRRHPVSIGQLIPNDIWGSAFLGETFELADCCPWDCSSKPGRKDMSAARQTAEIYLRTQSRSPTPGRVEYPSPTTLRRYSERSSAGIKGPLRRSRSSIGTRAGTGIAFGGRDGLFRSAGWSASRGVQMHDGRGKNRQAYLWQYSARKGLRASRRLKCRDKLP